MLLVGSVFRDHPRNRAWYDLQLKYLAKTTSDYDHAIYLNGVDNFYTKSITIGQCDMPPEVPQAQHIQGLNEIIQYFLKHDYYEHMLLLDNDAFPIAPGWYSRLRNTIDVAGYDVAAVVRCENLDTFAHPCVFFANRSGAAKLKFGYNPLKNMIGREFEDTSSNVDKFYALIRTNHLNHHPLLCGVYWNAFYHHGAGSRDLTFRVTYSYLEEFSNVGELEKTLFLQLQSNPKAFLYNLAPIDPPKKIYLC